MASTTTAKLVRPEVDTAPMETVMPGAFKHEPQPSHDVPIEPLPGSMPVEPDEGPIPATVPGKPQDDPVTGVGI